MAASMPMSSHGVVPAEAAVAAQQVEQEASGAGGAGGAAEWVPGCVSRVESPDEFKDYLRAYPNRLVVLMCKAKGCRPCKAFERKYAKIATEYQGCVFLDIYGDESLGTRKMMMALEVKSTPTFLIMREKNLVHTHAGIGESKLVEALDAFL